MILAIEQDKLFEETDILPIDLKTKLVDKILQSIIPLNSSIDTIWVKEANKRKTDIKIGNVTLIDSDEVFQKISQRYNKQMAYLFHPKAKEEFDIAIGCYEECKNGLELKFTNQIIILVIMQYNRKSNYWKNKNT